MLFLIPAASVLIEAVALAAATTVVAKATSDLYDKVVHDNGNNHDSNSSASDDE